MDNDGDSPKISKTSDLEPPAMLSDVTLPKNILHGLYQRYSIKQRRAGLDCFIAASILFDIWAIFIPQGQSRESLGITCVFLVLNIIMVIFLKLFGNCRYRGAIWEVAPHLLWLLAIMQLFSQLFFKGTVTPRDSLGWAILLCFMVFVTLPVPLRYALILLTLGTILTYANTIIGLSKPEAYFWEQQITNQLHLIIASAIGFHCYFLREAKHKRAFREAKQSLEVKMVIEEQSTEQERLLLSVLPEHVAVKMRQDLGSNDSEQFKKIYMSRHENVSILYADIVGFTAISSTYSAQDLVKMLNELFARFDRLAEKYHQLRIKILGDCYYCISGAPIERSDHAVLCVHMGLSMVKAIKYVQQKANSPVDMRVGIHTGAVLAGILGQKQWQFDVYSKDVELANKMESSGMAGRVHISEKTLSFLNGEFEIEPAYGEKREETLRIAGLKTYFIKSILKPFIPSENEYKNGSTTKNDTSETIEPDGPSEIFKDDDSKCHSMEEEASFNDQINKNIKEEDFKRRLKKELVSRDGHGELSKETTFLLKYRNKDLEKSFQNHIEPIKSKPFVASFFVHLIGVIYSSIIFFSSMIHTIVLVLPIILTSILAIISIAEHYSKVFPELLIKASQYFNNKVLIRQLAAIFVVLFIGMANIMDMLICSAETPIWNLTINSTRTDMFPSTVCIYFPSYFSNFAILILIVISLFSQLSHLCKILLMITITGFHCCINIYLLEEHFRSEDYHTWNKRLPLCYTLSATLIAITIALGLLARHMDKEDRVIFKWKTEVQEQKEKASDMRRRNEALVYNILPVHVAKHFMKNQSRSYNELYSQSYSEVGVLFASMPNFSDFYSEESVNNQGLECLRFLNEVISDFDALLSVPPFQDIIKIKTIGSTYMAASGLNPSRQVKDDDSILLRWEHLSLLVEFALELKKALHCINEQSFNHFVLKMGVNHGPITAGVIGARKPHYDIWGNTVNVASRMESTGKAGAIQVTEETCEILRTFGYTFEQRGLVAVKGKGQLLTFYLQGRNTIQSTDLESMMGGGGNNTMETVHELDEPSSTDEPKENSGSFLNSQNALRSPGKKLQQSIGPASLSLSPIKPKSPPTTHLPSICSAVDSPITIKINQELSPKIKQFFAEDSTRISQITSTISISTSTMSTITTTTTTLINNNNSTSNFHSLDSNLETDSNNDVISSSGISNNSTVNDDDILLDIDSTPLLLKHIKCNSTNSNAINFNDSNEKDALIN